MKLFYLNFTDLDNPRNAGLVKKQKAEIDLLSEHFTVGKLDLHGNNYAFVDHDNHEEHSFKSSFLIQYKKRILIYNKLYKFLEKNHYEALYLRYNLADMFLVAFLKKIKRIGLKIVIQIPTYPYHKEHNKVIYGVDQRYAKKLHKYVDRIITYSEDEEIYGVPTIQIRNGVEYSQISLKSDNDNSDQTNFLGVASLASWHGYDRLIKSIEQYYLDGNLHPIHFYIVGTGNEADVYHQIINESSISEKLKEVIHFEGFKFGKPLDDLFDIAHIGVEVLAMHRKGLDLSSSLKSKEYLAKGLPFITASKMDIRDTEIQKYFYSIDKSEDAFDLKKIIDFYQGLRDQYPSSLAQIIREESWKYCDIHNSFFPVIQFLKEGK